MRLPRLLIDRAGLLRAFVQDFLEPLRVRHEIGPAGAHRIEVRVQRARQLGLDLDVADLAGAVPGLQILDLRGVGIEGVVIHEHRIPLDGAGNIRANALRIRVHLADLLLHRLRVVRQVNRVPVTFRHLPVVEPGQPRKRRQQRLGLDEERAEEVVEPAHDLAAELEMRHLILADRDRVGVVDDDVGGLQERIAQEAERGQILLGQLLDLFLVGRHALEPRRRDGHRQQQIQLGVLGHQRLDEERAALGIEAGRDPVGGHVVGVGDDRRGVRVVAGQRVPVGDEVEAVVLVLQRGPVVEGADQMAEMELSGRAHPRHDAWFHRSSSLIEIDGGRHDQLDRGCRRASARRAR